MSTQNIFEQNGISSEKDLFHAMSEVFTRKMALLFERSK